MDRREELLYRWRGIEEDDDNDDKPDDSIVKLKEDWFSDAFNFLIHLRKEDHIWCGYWDLMGPLLETFYNFFEDERQDSPLKLLWKRISEELSYCTQCICQHHQAQESYNMEYESISVGPLVIVLRSLDEARITEHLKEINIKIARGEYDPVRVNAEVVSVMFEILMYPVLLDDQSLVSEFQIFIEAVDNSHELTLAGHQRYPGVYALLFLKSRRARSIGFRLAGQMGKLREASELEALHPLLKRYISFLEMEVIPSTTNVKSYRPRVQLERITIWHGIKSLLGFLEPPAFEEGILEHYPVFLSIVLNHISDDSSEFSFAVNCLRILFEMLGCKLWLAATLSPSVIHNTLLGQCFHTRNEKSHKDIFDLFQPFLQSLEALQDGEHEKQRRKCLYFLLHQVTVSSNFSILMRKKACQIAFRIILRGYRMNPPSPPFECAHMWCPSLVSTLKDSSLHSSLQQPAIDLIQTIIVSDAAALVAAMLNRQTRPVSDIRMSYGFNDEDEDQGLPFGHALKKDVSCWNEFSAQGEIAALDSECWMCIPMLWVDVLVNTDPLVLPVSFSKAVFWALSRLSMVEPLSNAEMVLPVGQWLTTSVSEISHLFGWKVPRGSDDGGDEKDSMNSAKVSTVCVPLVRTFKRLSTHYIARMDHGELWKQWPWEARMGESLILLLVDPEDSVRQVARRILEKASVKRTLACGLQFLCSCSSSLSAIYLGLRHALKLIELESVVLNFHTLHHFFFLLHKVLKEGITCNEILPGNLANDASTMTFSTDGGFLRQPIFNSLEIKTDGHSVNVDSLSWERFTCFLSAVAWPSILKCLAEGRAFVDHKMSQMTCIRLLETLPIIFERLQPSFGSSLKNLRIVVEHGIDFKWLIDLMEWGKSTLAVIVRYWKQTIISVLDILKCSCSDKLSSVIRAGVEFAKSDNVSMTKLMEHVSSLAVSLANEGPFKFGKANMNPEPQFSEAVFPKKHMNQLLQSVSLEDADLQILSSKTSVNKERDSVIVLSDDDMETSANENIGSMSNQSMLDVNMMDNDASDMSMRSVLEKENISCSGASAEKLKASLHEDPPDSINFVSEKLESDAKKCKLGSTSRIKPKSIESTRIETNSNLSVNNSLVSLHNFKSKNESNDSINKKIVGSYPSKSESNMKSSSHKATDANTMDQQDFKKVRKSAKMVIKELVHDTDNDPLDLALESAGRQHNSMSKLNAGLPKRKVIQLDLPAENRYGYIHRPDVGSNRFKPPKLEDWFKCILELDYLAIVGLAAPDGGKNISASKLKEVPVCFQSPDEYVSIFQPLVLEEFKAQLQSSFVEMSFPETCCGSLSVLSVERVDDFHIVRFVYDEINSSESKSCVENDLILLSKQQLQNGFHDVHMVGKVERLEKDNKSRFNTLVIRFYLQNGISRLNRARKLLLVRSKWFITRLLSITPQLREFQALSSIKNIPLLPVILNPVNFPCGGSESRKKYLTQLSQPLRHILKVSYNDSQVQAINCCIGSLDRNMDFDLSLIQGPPGTGKTRTIVAIVSGLLALRQRNDKQRENRITKSDTSCSSLKMHVSQSAAIARAWQDAALARQLNSDEEKNCKSTFSSKGRVLICAQSNAAVDELVSRITSDGLYGSDGVMYKPYLVRVGNAKTVHPNSLPYFIDTLVENRLAQQKMDAIIPENDMNVDSSTALRSKLEKLVDRIQLYEAKRANGEEKLGSKVGSVKEMCDADIGARLRKLYADKKAVYADLAAAQMREKKVNEESRALRRKLRKSILKEAEIVVTTLSGCGGDLYAVCSESVSNHKFGSSYEHTLFDAVVIDEAAQALEPATLIPLQLLKSKGSKCIMVGDPKQLPATVISSIASKYLYQCSMFERLQRAGHPVFMLTKQYRMHPEICRFPSLHFYDGKLLNGDNNSINEVQFHKTKALGPYVFFDIVDGQEFRGKNSGSLSFYNESEADAAVAILSLFKRRYPSDFSGGRIGIVTPYKSQLSLLRSRLSDAFGSSVAAGIEFNTVDGFQGREVDILVLSTVRATKSCSAELKISSGNIGFVADVRRMNVALTRAKTSLWILGNAKTLMTNKNWEALLTDAEKRNLVISIKKPYDQIFKSARNDNSILECSDDHFVRSKHAEEGKQVGWHAEQLPENEMSSYGRKRRCIGARSLKNVEAEDKNTFVEAEDKNTFPLRDADKVNGNKAKREHNLSANKDLGLVEESALNKTVKGVKFNITGHTKGDISSSKISKEKQHNLGTFNSSNGKGSLLDINGIDSHSKTDKKRKQQRAAVDAILSSALVSSKKTETSGRLVPSVRPNSEKNPRVQSIKSPKPRKATPEKFKHDA